MKFVPADYAPRHVVVVPNPGCIPPNFARIVVRIGSPRWDVVHVEYYASEVEAYRGGIKGFLGSIDFHALPESGKREVWDALDRDLAARRERIRAMLVEAGACQA